MKSERRTSEARILIQVIAADMIMLKQIFRHLVFTERGVPFVMRTGKDAESAV